LGEVFDGLDRVRHGCVRSRMGNPKL
jgi:hypothetical protein